MRRIIDEIMEDPIFERPLRIRRVLVNGNGRTRRNVIERELEAAKDGRTVREVSAGIMSGLHSLKELDVFQSVEVFCDVARKFQGLLICLKVCLKVCYSGNV
mmetsp:Transcript_32905/g.52484  ORF Transcript_32905/g.52484 Transcript_32905/m.52484 type:complete len:102 (+) Transcript_32905:2704-3009(+)